MMIYLSDKQLAGRYGVCRATVWRWTVEHGFPKPVKLSPGCSRWRLKDVEQYEAERAEVAE